MAGFGSGPFGSGPFGRFDWAREVLWRDIPPEDRRADQNENNRLEKFSGSVQPLFEELLLRVSDFGSLRDPSTVRTRFNERLTVTPTSAVVAPGGRTVEVFLADPDTSDPLVPLANVSVGWVFEDAEGAEFIVNSVHKLDTRGPVIELSGRSVPVTEEDLGAGNADAIVRPPALIGLLGNDYGVAVDNHEPEAFQRSAVRNVTQWLDLKGSARSYDILGKISGYRVTASGLWRIDGPMHDGLPSSRIFEIPSGSGRFYTDLSPTRPVFDDIAADVIPLDHFCFETLDWTSENIVPPDPDGDGSADVPDGTSVSEAIVFTMQGLPIVSTTDLGEGRARIRVSGDLFPIVSVGYWTAEFSGTPGAIIYMETEPVDEGGGEWSFEVEVGDASSFDFGSTVDMGYDCPISLDCNICRASVLRVEVEPEEILEDPEALLDGVLPRLVNKIQQVVPAHVRIVEIAHVIKTAVATLNIQANASASPSVVAPASVGYYYDIVEADVIDVDPPHLVATGVVSVVP